MRERVTTDALETVTVIIIIADIRPSCTFPQCTVQIVSRRRLQDDEESGTVFDVTRTFNASDNVTLTVSTFNQTIINSQTVLSVRVTARVPGTTTTDLATGLAELVGLEPSDLTVSVATNDDDDDDTNFPLLISLTTLPVVLALAALSLSRRQVTTPLVTEIPLQPLPPTPYTR